MPYQTPADALAALASVVRPAVPSASVVVGNDGAGLGRECCVDQGILRIEWLRIYSRSDEGLMMKPCGDLTIAVQVTWEQCVPVITESGGAPPADEVTAAHLAAINTGWRIFATFWGSDVAKHWRLLEAIPAGEGKCKGLAFTAEATIRVCPIKN